MAWLSGILNNCMSEYCELNNNISINSKIFWENVASKIKLNETLKLFHEKNIYLSDAHESTLVLGLNPIDEFNVYGRMEIKSTSSVLIFNASEIIDLLKCIDEQLNENTIFPLSLSTSFIGNTDGNHHIRLTSSSQKYFKITNGKASIKADQDTLLKLKELKPFVKTQIHLLQIQRQTCESSLFKLLNHYFFEKSIEGSLQLAKSVYMFHFFNEVIDHHCDCLNKIFTIEFATNFSKLFSEYVPLFIETLMVNEKSRQNTYLFNWPHDKDLIDTKLLAKSGLYFTGKKDLVKCAFCNVELYDWSREDNPFIEHYKYSKKCPFILNPFCTMNVIEGCQKHLIKTIMETVFVNRDEVDKKHK